MKLKHLIACAAVAFSALTASAQEGFRFGVTAGMNVSNVTHLVNPETDCKLGFNAGVRAEYNFNKNFYMNAGLLWSMQGAYKKWDLMKDLTATFKINPSYLQIPIHVGGRICLGDGVSIFGETGPYFAVGVCGKSKTSYSSSIAGEGGADADYFDKANRFDAGWGVRAGVEVSNIQIHLGYDHGFVKVYDNDAKKIYCDGKAYNWNFSVGLSYMF